MNILFSGTEFSGDILALALKKNGLENVEDPDKIQSDGLDLRDILTNYRDTNGNCEQAWGVFKLM